MALSKRSCSLQMKRVWVAKPACYIDSLLFQGMPSIFFHCKKYAV